MGLETATYLADLNSANPVHASDSVGQGDDHIRLIKSTLLATFPNFVGAPVTKTEAELNAAVNVPQFKDFSADFTINNDNVLQDITGLTGFTLETDAYYWLEAFFSHNAISVVADYAFALQFSDAPQEHHLAVWNSGAARTVSEEITAGAKLPIIVGGDVGVFRLTAAFRANAADGGTLDLQAAQNTAHASNSTLIFGNASVWKTSG